MPSSNNRKRDLPILSSRIMKSQQAIALGKRNRMSIPKIFSASLPISWLRRIPNAPTLNSSQMPGLPVVVSKKWKLPRNRATAKVNTSIMIPPMTISVIAATGCSKSQGSNRCTTTYIKQNTVAQSKPKSRSHKYQAATRFACPIQNALPSSLILTILAAKALARSGQPKKTASLEAMEMKMQFASSRKKTSQLNMFWTKINNQKNP